LKLWQKVILGMVLGGLVGHLLGNEASFFRYIGEAFINMIKMVVVPLIFFSILNGVTNLNDAATFNRLGSRALIYYTMTTVFAVVMGLFFATVFEPGIGLNINLDTGGSGLQTARSLLDIVTDIIPTNPIKAMAEGHIMQVVMFAFFTGFALIKIGEQGREVKSLVASATQLVFKMIELVIKLTPYGVFAIMAWVIGIYGIDVFFSLAKFCFVVMGAFVVQYLLFGALIFVCGRISPMPFYRKMIETQVLALATVSSKATLSTADHVLRTKMGVSKQSSSFILPLGASMNMDGTAIYLGICSVFFAQMTGVELSLSQYIIIIVTCTLGSIGAAGIPGGSMAMMGMVLSSVGLPLEGMTIVIGVDRFLDMLRTVINITGDCAVTLIVDKAEGTFNSDIYNS
jgi:Na+/H+-dicarboxylate symporter